MKVIYGQFLVDCDNGHWQLFAEYDYTMYPISYEMLMDTAPTDAAYIVSHALCPSLDAL